MTEEQLSKILKPLEWYEKDNYPEDQTAGTNLWYDFVLEWSMDQYNLLKRDINGEVDLVRDGIKTLEEGYELAWEEYVDDVMSMFK